jgi:uncharacterized protein
MGMSGVGLDEDGFIRREGDLARVPAAFAPVIEAAKIAIGDMFGPDVLHSAYLYGSVPRGTAVRGVSDLDLFLVLRGEPTAADRDAARRLERLLDDRFPQVNGVGVGLASVTTVLSELERHDLGWFVACLCTPLIGEDLAVLLPKYRPSPLLARETNGDIGNRLPRWRELLSNAKTNADLHALSRSVSRVVVRTGFTLVMPRWGGWTSDLELMSGVFGQYYPDRRDQMRAAVAVVRVPTTDVSVLAMLIDDLGEWLAAEYLAVHGPKTPRPE